MDSTKCILLLYQKDKEKILEVIENKLGYPCFIKPCNGGSSIGMKKAKDKKEVEEGFDLAFNYDRKVIVEKAVFTKLDI